MNRKQRRAAGTRQKRHGGGGDWRERAIAMRDASTKALVRNFTLVDGWERNRLHPDRFEIPTSEDIATVKPGSVVMIYRGTHGLDLGDEIEFRPMHIVTLMVDE